MTITNLQGYYFFEKLINDTFTERLIAAKASNSVSVSCVFQTVFHHRTAILEAD